MVGVLSNRVDRLDLAAGDHIYSWRTAYLYAHHGIYIGDAMVIHFTRAAGHEIGTGTFLDMFLFSSSPATEGPPCEKCGHLIKQQGVIMSCLDCFLDGGNPYLFDYAVSPAFFLAKARGGTCTLAASDPADIVIHRAQHLLNSGFGTYSLFKNNCEDFAIYCKTGLLVETAFSVGRSGQLASLTAAFSAVASSPLRFLTTSAGGLAVVTSGMYCVGRYVSDIGVRRDVVKVPVERLVEHWPPRDVAVAPPPQESHQECQGNDVAPQECHGDGDGGCVSESLS
uniref:LRAT domain-containing protein n=1 Tax=Oryza glumipatula TaxID=40148 RepID=A0A0D9ZX74_9ORYZ